MKTLYLDIFSGMSGDMLIGALIAGGAIMMGSHESGRHTRNFLFGAIFLVLAGAGLAIYDRVSGLLR